jgi:uncharacterized protein (TIGR02001 family)
MPVGRVKRLRHLYLLGIACSVALAAAAPARAQEEGAGPDVSGTIALVSDYRFRGVSLSDGKPALQGGIEIEADGWFAGGWGSTLSERGRPGVEADVYAGRRGASRGFRYSVAGYAYLTGMNQPAYVEIQTVLGHGAGQGWVELELSYAPRQNGGTDNVYLGGRASLPIRGTGFTLMARGGFEHGHYDKKFDWEVGASWSPGPVILSATVTGARERRPTPSARVGTTAVFSILHAW